MNKYYDSNLEKQLKNLIGKPNFDEWLSIVKPILLHDEFQRRKLFRHHDSSVWNHCINVSFNSFNIAKKNNLDGYTCAVAGLLHDFYPYAYKYDKELEKLDKEYMKIVGKKIKLRQQHGFVHAHEAAMNAIKFFPGMVNNKVISCIETHMFPLNIKPPKYKEGWIITYVDKKVSFEVVKEIKYIPSLITKKAISNMKYYKI